MKLSIFCPFGLKTPIDAPKLGFWGYFTPKMGAISTRPPKGTSAGRNGSSGVLIILAKARDYVFTGVGLSVCLSVCLFVTTITK